MSLNVSPDGLLDRGVTITVSCTLHYGAPAQLSAAQDPTIELTLDNEPAFPTGHIRHETLADTDNFHRKSLVIFVIVTVKFYLLHKRKECNVTQK